MVYKNLLKLTKIGTRMVMNEKNAAMSGVFYQFS